LWQRRTVLLHPPYSPGLASSDFYHFGALRVSIRGKRFGSDEEITEEVPASTKFKLIKKKSLDALVSRWCEAAEFDEGYVEK